MATLDETDLDILQLLLADARRPYSEIADVVDLSAPAVSDRIARLQEIGLIKRFTIDIDRSQLRQGIPVLVRLAVDGERRDRDALEDTLLDADAVEHVFTTAEGGVIFVARVPDNDVAAWLQDTTGDRFLGDDDVTLLSGVEWSPELGDTDLALSCAQCGNTVDSEGTATRIDGDLYQFCCPSCETRFIDKYQQLEERAR